MPREKKGVSPGRTEKRRKERKEGERILKSADRRFYLVDSLVERRRRNA